MSAGGATLAIPTFTRLKAGDLPMLCEWLERPHVRRWWLEPSSIEELSRD